MCYRALGVCALQSSSYYECVATFNSVHPDPTMTVDNVTQILNKIPGDKWEEVTGERGLDIPRPLMWEIQWRYSTDTEKNHACADYYVNCHPEAKWERLTVELYDMEEFALAKESKSFMPTGNQILPLCVLICYTCVIIHTDILVLYGG